MAIFLDKSQSYLHFGEKNLCINNGIIISALYSLNTLFHPRKASVRLLFPLKSDLAPRVVVLWSALSTSLLRYSDEQLLAASGNR